MSERDLGQSTSASPGGNPDALMNCPKCGFAQPVDQYCAKCGIDMTLVPKKSAPFVSQTVAISSIAIVAIIVTVAGVRATRKSSNEEAQRLQSVGAFASESPSDRAAKRRERLNARASDQTQNNLEQASAAYNVDVGATLAAGAETAKADATNANDTSTGAAPALAATHAVATANTAGATTEQGRLVAFAWAEVSHQWLQAMGATEPGLHPVPNLEARLREMPGTYRIVESSRQHLIDLQSVVLSRGDRINVRFDVQTVTDMALTGSLQSSLRTPDGAVRSPAAAAVSIERGQGSIVSFGAAGTSGPPPGAPVGVTPPGAASTGTEIVVLILPRWEADRNP